MPGKIIPEKLKAGYNSNIFEPKIVSKGYSKYLFSKEGEKSYWSAKRALCLMHNALSLSFCYGVPSNAVWHLKHPVPFAPPPPACIVA